MSESQARSQEREGPPSGQGTWTGGCDTACSPSPWPWTPSAGRAATPTSRAAACRRGDFSVMILAESALLLGFGLAFGVGAALVAIVPAFLERGGALPGVALAPLLASLR